MRARRDTRAVLAAALAFGAVLGGCAGVDGVELNGGVFDMLGVSDKSSSGAEPKVPQRAGIVLPPDPTRLPPPGSGGEQIRQAAADPQWPVDPEEQRKQQVSARQRQHEEFCAREIQRSRAMKEIAPPMGPLGRCEGSILSVVNGGKNIGETMQGQQPSGLPR